jgi:hypothetical protein
MYAITFLHQLLAFRGYCPLKSEIWKYHRNESLADFCMRNLHITEETARV